MKVLKEDKLSSLWSKIFRKSDDQLREKNIDLESKNKVQREIGQRNYVPNDDEINL